MCKCKKRNAKKGFCPLRLVGRLLSILLAVYAVLFAVFFFDLDGKLLYYVVEPFLAKHYDKMERKNPLDMPYKIQS